MIDPKRLTELIERARHNALAEAHFDEEYNDCTDSQQNLIDYVIELQDSVVEQYAKQCRTEAGIADIVATLKDGLVAASTATHMPVGTVAHAVRILECYVPREKRQ